MQLKSFDLLRKMGARFATVRNHTNPPFLSPRFSFWKGRSSSPETVAFFPYYGIIQRMQSTADCFKSAQLRGVLWCPAFWKTLKLLHFCGNVVDMAVGVIIGGAFGKIVASFVSDIIMPPIGMILGGVDFSNLFINLSSKKVDTSCRSNGCQGPCHCLREIHYDGHWFSHHGFCHLPHDFPPESL